MSKTITIAPFNRVEGDLKIKVEIKDRVVTDARVSGVMFRGFEKILKGCRPEEALVYTPRICGICSISHSVACSNALGSVSGEFTPSPNGKLAAAICHAVENAMSHVTQFYLYFAPDLLNKKYEKQDLYRLLVNRLSPDKGISFQTIMTERKKFLEILGVIAGKWPHTLAIQPGGITKALSVSDIVQIQGAAAQFCSVVEKTLLGMPIGEYLAIRSAGDFENVFSKIEPEFSDLALFHAFSLKAGFTALGKGPGAFVSGGGYAQPDGSLYIPSGFWKNGWSEFDADNVTEAIKYSYFDGTPVSRPLDDMSEPKGDKPGAYSWAKAPRYKGEVIEVGALGRQIISNDPVISGFFSRFGSTVFTRVLARLHEGVKLLQIIRQWAGGLEAGGQYYVKNTLQEAASGAGITEAARGMLGHWMSVENGRIKNYQVITPTGWNASPRDENGTPGAIEQALISTKLEDEANPIEIDHIIRSYDPCLVCTVH